MNNNISFQGKSFICADPKRFKEVVSNPEIQRRVVNAEKQIKINNWKTYLAEVEPDSFTIVLKSDKDGRIEHVPTSNPSEEILSNLCDRIDDLAKKAKGKITAWIIGGDSIEAANGTKTIDTLDKVADVVCDKPNIDASILVGNKNGLENFTIHSKNDELEIGLGNSLKLDKNSTPEENLEQLFDIVELNNTELKMD